jgi:hypothetical protein
VQDKSGVAIPLVQTVYHRKSNPAKERKKIAKRKKGIEII